MKTSMMSAAVAVCCASPLSAQAVCEMGGAVPVPLFERAKAAFLREDYTLFSDITTEVMVQNKTVLDGPLKQLQALIRNGYDSCQTIVQRRDAGGMIQEVTTFNIRGQAFPMSVYLMAVPIRDEMKIGYVGFNTSLMDVLDELR